MIFAFFHFSKSPGILVFWFFWFSRGFFDFCIFPFPRVLEYCFFLFFLVFLVFSRFFGLLHFSFSKSPGILFFLFFFGFLESSFDFCIFFICKTYVFFLFFAFFLPRGVFQDV